LVYKIFIYKIINFFEFVNENQIFSFSGLIMECGKPFWEGPGLLRRKIFRMEGAARRKGIG
jgi:hypothetical protein